MSDGVNTDEERRTVSDRTIELLRHTTSSVAVHLEQVEGWLKLAGVRGEPDFWRVDVVIGPIGALADAWGRLTLLARVTDAYSEVIGDLESVMDGLVSLLSRLLSGDIADDEIETVKRLTETVRSVYATAVLDHLPRE
jgi:hypothetical protein